MIKKIWCNKNHMAKEKIAALATLTRTVNINLENLKTCQNKKVLMPTDFTSLNQFEVLQKNIEEHENDFIKYNNVSLNSHKEKTSSNTNTKTKLPTTYFRRLNCKKYVKKYHFKVKKFEKHFV